MLIQNGSQCCVPACDIISNMHAPPKVPSHHFSTSAAPVGTLHFHYVRSLVSGTESFYKPTQSWESWLSLPKNSNWSFCNMMKNYDQVLLTALKSSYHCRLLISQLLLSCQQSISRPHCSINWYQSIQVHKTGPKREEGSHTCSPHPWSF